MVDPGTLRQIRGGITSPDAEVRAACVDALVSLADVRGLLAALRSNDAYVRSRAARALSDAPGGRVTWSLARLLRDDDARVRDAVAQALARRGGWFAARTLAHLAADTHPVVRHTALTALAHLDWRRARPLLLRALAHDSEGWVRDAAGTLLRRHAAQRARRLRHPTLPRATPPGNGT